VVHRALKHLLRGGKPDVPTAAIEDLRTAATAASTRERAAMEVEREVVDLYRTLYMRSRLGEVFEGTVSALVGSGFFVTLDHPFVDVLVRFEALGPDHYEATEDELAAVGLRSGDRIALGDRVLLEIEEVAVLRRVTLARRIPPERLVKELSGAPPGEKRRHRRFEGKPRGKKGDKRNERPASKSRGAPRPGRRRR